MTFHRAKGLEWQVVFVTGLERGLVPISWAGTPDARAEERRLLHVALGRAETGCTARGRASERRAAGDRARQPSPWLGELEAGDPSPSRSPRSTAARIGDAARDARAHVGEPPPTSRRPKRCQPLTGNRSRRAEVA